MNFILYMKTDSKDKQKTSTDSLNHGRKTKYYTKNYKDHINRDNLRIKIFLFGSEL